MENSFIVIELKGFTQLAVELSKRMDQIGLTSERVRGAGIEIIEHIFKIVNKKIPFVYKKQIGADTWIIKFNDLEDAIKFGYHVFSLLLKNINENGIFFLKPSIAINTGEPRFKDEKFIDDKSIRTYRVADSGEPFTFYILDDAINYSKQYSWVKIKEIDQDKSIQSINWFDIKDIDVKPLIATKFVLPTLLLDSEIIYSNTPVEAINNILHQQESAHSIFTFGGPVPIDPPYYKKYLKNSIKLIKNKTDCTWVVLSYIPLNEPLLGLTWLELCKRLSVQYPQRFTFAAFLIPEGQLRPFSYHIYNESIVQIGLRSFSPQHGVSIMNAAIMIRNEKIANRFKNEFQENLRKIGPMNDGNYAKITDEIKGVNQYIKKKAFETVDKLLK
jgi:hypothetical protein